MQTPLVVVTLNNAYNNIADSRVADLFAGLMMVRRGGYGPEYERSLLPFDLCDFVGWHHLFCIREAGKLVPIGGYKNITQSRCDFYHLTMPLMSILEGAGARTHLAAVNGLREEFRARRMDTLYCGSFTIIKSWRTDREVTGLIRELVAALMYLDFTEGGYAAIFGLGAIRFKMEKFFASIGYEAVTHEGRPLDPIGIAHASGEPVVPICLRKTTDWARECFEKHQFLLRSRLIVGDEGMDQEKRTGTDG